LPLAWVQATWAALPRAALITGPVLACAAIAGSGAFVNGACPMGTLPLVGLAVGFVILDATQFLPAVATLPERSDSALPAPW